jgi:hypothetical protein
MSEDELLSLLDESRNRNQRQNITGILLYGRGSFFQVLEGDKKDVEEIYKVILNDDRNYGNIIILKSEIDERSFPGWSMGFKDLRKLNNNSVEGYSDFMNSTDENIRNHHDVIIKLLYQFKEYA